MQEKAQSQLLTQTVPTGPSTQPQQSILNTGLQHQPPPFPLVIPPKPSTVVQSDLQLIQAQKVKKLKKEAKLGVDSPMGLALVYLQTDSFDRSAFIKAAVRRRAKQPNSNSSFSIIRQPKYLEFDNILIINLICKMYEHEIDFQRAQNVCAVETDRITVLIMDYGEISKAIIKDAFIVPPEILFPTFEALFTAYPQLIGLWTEYEAIRPRLPTQAREENLSLRNLTGFCLKYNMADKCNDVACKYRNDCFICLSSEHPAVRCNKNPVRWKDNDSYHRGGGYRRGGKGRGGYNRYGRNNYGGGYYNNRGGNGGYSQPPNYDRNDKGGDDSAPNDSNRSRFNKKSQNDR